MRLRIALPILLFTALFCRPASSAETYGDQIERECHQNAHCTCQSRELLKRTPRSTLQSILAQPKSNQRLDALMTALLNTYLRDHIAIDRVCGPPLHPDTDPAT